MTDTEASAEKGAQEPSPEAVDGSAAIIGEMGAVLVQGAQQVGPFVILDVVPEAEIGIRPSAIIAYQAEEEEGGAHRTLVLHLSSGAAFRLRFAAQTTVVVGDDDDQRWNLWDAAMAHLLRDARDVVDRLP